MLEVASKVKSVFGYGSQSSSTVVTGASVDTKGFTHLMVLINLGLIASTGTGVHKLQHSDDDSTFADITGATVTQVDGTDDNSVLRGALKLEANTIKRYVRVVSTFGTAATLASATYLLTGGHNPPNEDVALDFDV